MNDAAFARRHGIELEGLAGLADALRGHAGGKFQFLEARVAVTGAIEAHMIMQTRIEAEPAMGDMFEREKEFGVVLKENVLVWAAEADGDFGIVGRRGGFGGGGYVVFDGEAERGDDERKETAQLGQGLLALKRGQRPRDVRVGWTAGRGLPGRLAARCGSVVAHSFFFLNLLREGSG